MMKVMITGSFDPVTVGHEDVIRRVAALFPQVRVTVFIHETKPGMFSADERVRLLKKVCAKFPNVTVDFDGGMVKDYVQREKIDLIVRSVRSEADLAYEMKMGEYNRIHGGVETLLLSALPAFSDISSSEVRRRILAKEPFSSLLPLEIRDEIEDFTEKQAVKQKI